MHGPKKQEFYWKEVKKFNRPLTESLLKNERVFCRKRLFWEPNCEWEKILTYSVCNPMLSY